MFKSNWNVLECFCLYLLVKQLNCLILWDCEFCLVFWYCCDLERYVRVTEISNDSLYKRLYYHVNECVMTITTENQYSINRLTWQTDVAILVIVRSSNVTHVKRLWIQRKKKNGWGISQSRRGSLVDDDHWWMISSGWWSLVDDH